MCAYLTITEKTRKHKLGTVAHSIDSAVLDNQPLVGSKQGLKRSNNPAKIRFVPSVVHGPLSIENVVEGDQVLGFIHGTGAHTSQLLHVSTNAEKKTEVHAKSTDIGTSLTADPEDTKVAIIVEFDELALVNRSDTQLTLDGGDERRALEQGTGHGLKGFGELGLATGQLVVQADDGNIFLSGTLLRLDKSSGAVDTNDQTTSDLGVEGTTVTSLLGAINQT